MCDNKKNRELKVEKWERVKGSLHLIVMKYDLNKKALSNVPHVPFLDLAFCVYVTKRDCAEFEISMIVQYSHMEDWGVDLQELFRAARDNTYHMENIFVDSINNVIQSTGDICQLTDNDEGPSMLIISNKRKFHGASMIGNTDLLLTLAERLDSDFYILPSSVHELIVIPSTLVEGVAYLQDIVWLINRTEIKAEEYLSDEVYFFDRGSRSVTVTQSSEEAL